MSTEDLKRTSGYLRGELAADLARDAAAFEHESSATLLKFHGIYQQDDRDVRRERASKKLPLDYSCMVRASVPGGVIAAEQWQALDRVSDLADGTLGAFGRAALRPIDETSAEYLLSLEVADRPGVLHAVTGVFARNDVSIRAAEQEGNAPDAKLVFITHVAQESAVQATLRELRELDVVSSVGGLLRVVGS